MTPKALGRKGKPCRISKVTRGTVGATCRVRVRASHEKSAAITSSPSLHRYCVSRPSPHPRSSTGATTALERRHDSQGTSHRAWFAGEAEASLRLRRAAKRRSHSAFGSCERSVPDIDHGFVRLFPLDTSERVLEKCASQRVVGLYGSLGSRCVRILVGKEGPDHCIHPLFCRALDILA